MVGRVVVVWLRGGCLVAVWWWCGGGGVVADFGQSICVLCCVVVGVGVVCFVCCVC